MKSDGIQNYQPAPYMYKSWCHEDETVSVILIREVNKREVLCGWRDGSVIEST